MIAAIGSIVVLVVSRLDDHGGWSIANERWERRTVPRVSETGERMKRLERILKNTAANSVRHAIARVRTFKQGQY